MGRRATGSVFARGSEVRIQFQWQGRRVSETLHDYSALNPSHMRQAEKVLANIVLQVGNGTFDYASNFPDSKHASATASGAITFGAAMDSYLARIEHTKSSRSKGQYKTEADAWKAHIGADSLLHKLTPQRLSDIVYVERTWSGPSRLNNALIPLRGALRIARASDKTLPDWLESLENMDKSEGDPDPLTPAEMRSVLTHLRDHHDLRAWSWFAFSFATGLRPSEQCVLLHKDIVNSAAHVTKAQDIDGSVKPTKTKGKRTVDMSPLALEAVDVSKAYPNATGEIFQNPWSGRPWHGNRSQHENIWAPTLTDLGIESRRAYCTRHTFATTLLMAGARTAYVSAQMGHTSPSMVEKTYTRWIPNGDGGRSVALLQAAFAGMSGEAK